MKVYSLHADMEKFSIFLWKDKGGGYDENFIIQMGRRDGQPFGASYTPQEFMLERSDTGKLNYKMDISTFTSSFIIFSEKAVAIFKEILEQTGEILPIITPSKQKTFFGFHPTLRLKNCVNWEESIYTEYPNGKRQLRKIVLLEDALPETSLFMIEEAPTTVFVTDIFKKLVEKSDLKGFDFSREIELSNK